MIRVYSLHYFDGSVNYNSSVVRRTPPSSHNDCIFTGPDFLLVNMKDGFTHLVVLEPIVVRIPALVGV